MDGTITIRDQRPGEDGAVRELTLRAYAEYARTMEPGAWAGLDRAVRGALASDGAAERIVAERGGEVVGSVRLYPPGGEAYRGMANIAAWAELRLLAVAPETRGRGIGRALVDECVRRARRLGAAELGLRTSESMPVALGMYLRMGFVHAPEHDFRPEHGELVRAYRLALRPDLATPADR